MNFKIEVKNIQHKKFLSTLYDTEILMKKIAARAHSLIIERVKNGVTPQNAPVTKAIKQGDKTLRDNGQLLSSIRWKATKLQASVASNHIAAVINNPEDDRTHIVIKAKKAKYLTFPASAQTRIFQRRYGFTPREVISGLEKDGWNVYRPMVASGSRPANIILARKPAGKTGKQKKAVPLFILRKSVKQPVRRFLYLNEVEMKQIDSIVEDFYTT